MSPCINSPHSRSTNISGFLTYLPGAVTSALFTGTLYKKSFS
uniref:Uncharacterized protein n=1 Tax=virus sp. ctx9V1 TaxID=2828001 RepID=A0A8S5RD37_9VIRU|nr:MAG TPA: hypothetical protein [virus sp. ctx9V1]